jgi:phosphoglycerol transferase MdoB-like AlkP superfamily enzyme
MKPPSKKKNTLLKIAILIPIAFLFFYHTSKLYNIYFGNDFVTSNEFLKSFEKNFPIATVLILQSVFRIVIVTGLLLIYLKKNIGILFMWLGILSLITTQFIIANQSNNELIHSIHSGLKPLKGLILPIVISLLYKRIISNH